MLNSIKRTVGSGSKKYDVTIGFEGMDDEQVQADAMSFYVWKIQRTLRDASDEERVDYLADGIHLHATEVGKPVVSTDKMVNQMSDEQAAKAFELLKAKLGK